MSTPSSSPLPTALQHAILHAPLQEALAAILAHFQCQAGTYHRADGSLLTLETALHIPEAVLSLVQHVPFGKGIAGLAAERLAPVSLCNLQTDTSGQARPNARATGMEGSLAVPALDASGVLRGVLGIAKSQAHDWSEAETNAVSQAAALLASRNV